MNQYCIEAILLVVRNSGESDKMVTLFSREYGKMTAFAYGARRTRNRLSGAMQPFVHADLALMSGKVCDSIKQCDTKNSFRELKENLQVMAYSAFIAELVIEIFQERQAEPLVFDLLLDIFKVITTRNPRLVALAGAWQLLEIAGFRPELERCVHCGKHIELPAYFKCAAGGAVCTSCGSPDMTEIDRAVIQFTESLLHLDWNTPGRFSVTGAILTKAEKIFMDYLLYQVEKPLKSLLFIRQITAARAVADNSNQGGHTSVKR